MDQNAMVRNGHDLLDALDRRGLPIGAALWVHNKDVDTWKLWMIPRNATDKREFYRKVADVIAEDRDSFDGLDASDTEIVSKDHSAITALRGFAKVLGRSSIRLENNMLNGYYMTDGVILLMDL